MTISTTNSWSTRYHEQNKVINADQVEFQALINKSSSIRIGTSDERMADALTEFDNERTGELPHWGVEDIQLDNAEGSTAEEIQRRIRLLGALYPFKLKGASLHYTPHAEMSGLYEALLCITQAENLTTGKYSFLPRHFESLSCIVSELYLGADSAAFRTGWPRGKGEPKRLKALITKLREMTGDMKGEWFWKPKEGHPDDPSVRDVKECGLDVVAWKKSIDKRTGQLYMLGQCACGKNWLDDEKFSELRYKNINDWVEEFNIKPITAYFTPWHAIDEIVLDASRKAGLFFDRVRIVLYAENSNRFKSAPTQAIIQKIIKTVCA
jgi:hypothetical protein